MDHAAVRRRKPGQPGAVGDRRGGVGRDGTPLVTLGRFIGRATNNVAEYRGLITALRGGAKLGASRVIIRGDSELIIRQMRGEYRVKNPDLKQLYDEAQQLLRRVRGDEDRAQPAPQERAGRQAGEPGDGPPGRRDRRRRCTASPRPSGAHAPCTPASARPRRPGRPSPVAPAVGRRFACDRCGCVSAWRSRPGSGPTSSSRSSASAGRRCTKSPSHKATEISGSGQPNCGQLAVGQFGDVLSLPATRMRGRRDFRSSSLLLSCAISIVGTSVAYSRESSLPPAPAQFAMGDGLRTRRARRRVRRGAARQAGRRARGRYGPRRAFLHRRQAAALLGGSIAFSGALPTHEQADEAARRLAGFGINCVRFHHIDMQPFPNGMFADCEAGERFRPRRWTGWTTSSPP